MRTAIGIYDAYRIPEWLQMHQLRVAAVGKLVADRVRVDTESVILCGLFHDMANILKIDLSPGGNLAVPVADDELQRLVQLKDNFREKYGPDEHAASIAIGREIGLSETVLDMIDNMRFLRSEWVLNEGSMEMKIAKYSDLRVSPFGIVGMQARFDEAAKRYKNRGFDTDDKESEAMRARMNAACWEIEAFLMHESGMQATEINDESGAPVIAWLRDYQV